MPNTHHRWEQMIRHAQWKSFRVIQAREPNLAKRFDHKKDEGSFRVWQIELNRVESVSLLVEEPFLLSRFGLEINQAQLVIFLIFEIVIYLIEYQMMSRAILIFSFYRYGFQFPLSWSLLHRIWCLLRSTRLRYNHFTVCCSSRLGSHFIWVLFDITWLRQVFVALSVSRHVFCIQTTWPLN